MCYLLSTDIGTTNIKAALFDASGKLLFSRSSGYPTTHDKPGYAEQQPSDWYDCTAKVIRSLISECGIEASKIACLSLTGHIRSVAFFDNSFETAYPGIIWSDTRAFDISRSIKERYDKTFLQINGNKADTNYALPNILWLRQNEPQLWEKVRFLANPKDYVIYRLTSSFVSDPSNQAGSLLLDADTKTWSNQLLELFSINEAMLPEIRRSTDIAGHITAQAARETLLLEGTPVVVGGGDNDTAALGAGAYLTGDVSVSLGTAGIILTPLDSPMRELDGKLDLFPHIIETKWYGMGMIKAAGYAVDWLRRFQSEVLGDNIPKTGEWMNAIGMNASKIEPGSDGLFNFPYYQGRGNPDKRADIRGVFWGIGSNHSGRHFAQATMEGVAYCIRQCVECIEKYAPVSRVMCCGGGSENPTWMEIIASVLGRPILKCGSDEGARGTAILGATAVGLYDSIETAADKMILLEKAYEPNAGYTEKYRELFSEYEALSNHFWKID